MLIEIVLKDYTTFINETKFDFRATNYKILEDTNVGSNRVLKGALFVGENASGKTQVLRAILLLLRLLFENGEQTFVSKKSLYTKGTQFSLSYGFDVDKNIVKYSVLFDGNSIKEEKLYINDELKLDRLNNSGSTYFGDKKFNDDISSSLSLLKLEYYNTKFNNDIIMNKLFDFLKNSIYIDCLNHRIISCNSSRSDEQILEKYVEKNSVDKFNNFIGTMGYNSRIEVAKKISNKNNSISFNSPKDLIGVKKIGTDVTIPLKIESTGNQAFINLVLPIIYTTNNNGLFLVDEFSSGLHNSLEESLIRYFFDNSKDSQLFFTSHSTNLLDTFLLRPDQIYSFQFDSKKGTLVKRFSDENPRESQNLEKMYLNGVFDGMPEYKKSFKD